MADFAPDYTERYRIRYLCSTRIHKITFRLDQSLTPGGLSDLITAVGVMFDDALPSLAGDFAFLDASYAARNSSIFLPVAAPVITGTPNPLNTASKGNSPRFFSFGGLSAAGNGTRVFIYGVAASTDDETQARANDYRILPGEGGAAIAALNDYKTLPALVAADNAPLVYFYDYVNVGLNAYYQRKARTS